MSKTLRFLPALGAVLFALVGISACGGIPGDAVVQVNGTPITKTAFEHWMSVAAASTKRARRKSRRSCTAELHRVHRASAATSPKPAKGQSAPTTAQLKSSAKRSTNRCSRRCSAS